MCGRHIELERVSKKICWANTTNLKEADVVVIGIPDESGSHAARSGASKAPGRIRKVSNARDMYADKDFRRPALPAGGLQDRRVYDYGNIRKRQIPKEFARILAFPKIPISIGGDHSNTTPILKALSKKHGKISLIYFDAHPDFVSNARNYYGSVVTDSLDYIDVKSSIQIGIRTPEPEETVNLKKYGLKVITPFDIVEKGIMEAAKIIKDTAKGNTYVSFDMDCIDPAYAPGVSVPVPLGLESPGCAYLLKEIASRGIIGMDVMEVCPAHDLNDLTSHLASRLIGEVISSCKV